MTEPLSSRRKIVIRSTLYNRLSFPVLLNVWETEGLDRLFRIIVRSTPLHQPPFEPLSPRDVVLFSFMTPHLPEVHEEIRFIAPLRPIIAGGGPHITGEQELALEMGFQYLFTGPAESTFRTFAHHLLDRLPPAPHIYGGSGDEKTLSAYIPVSRYFREAPPLEIMRGCRWNCSYCTTGGHQVFYRSLESIHRYLAALREKGLNRINFICPSALEFHAAAPRSPNPPRIRELMEITHAHGFRFIEFGIFPSEIRPDTVTAEALNILKTYVSHKSITIGAQSGCDQRLKNLSRGHSTNHIQHAASLCNAAGFLANLDFIVAYPDETPEEQRTTADFIRHMQRHYRIRTFPHHFFPLSGSRLAQRLPAFMNESAREFLLQLHKNGQSENGWLDNESQTIAFFRWLETYFPHIRRQYH